MRYIKLIKVLCLLSAFVLLASCGGGTGGGAGTSTVTIAIGGTGQLAVIEQQEKTLFAKLFNFISPDDALAGTLPPPGPDLCFIPPDVHRVVFNISGLGMAPISREVIVGTQCPIIEEFEVPNGSQRIFSADEYSVSGAHLYTGATAQDIFGADHVRIIMHKADECELYVDASNGIDSSNDCRDANNRCSTITHALTQTDGNETICVAAGWYDDEDGNEIFPLQLKKGTRLLCQGPEHSSIIEPFNWDTAIIGAEGASVEGCRIVSGYPAVDDNESTMTINDNIIENTCIGINLYANSTVSNNVFQNMASNECQNQAVIAGGNGAFIDGNTLVNIGPGMNGIEVTGNNVTITNNEITGNSTGIRIHSPGTEINNNVLSCNRIDIQYGYLDFATINVKNNQWDNVPPDSSPSFYEGVDILYSGYAVFETDGASLAPSPCSTAPRCLYRALNELMPGQRAIYVFQTTSLTESIDVQLTSNEPSQLSFLHNSVPIVCDPVCGSTNYDTSLSITHVFTSADYYAIQVSNFGSSTGTHSLDVTMMGDESVCQGIALSFQDIPKYNVSTSVTGLGAGSQFDLNLLDMDGNFLATTTITGNGPYSFIGLVVEGMIISMDIANVPPDQTCTFQTPFSGTTLTDTITSDVTYDIVCEPIPTTPGDPCAGVVCDSGFTCIDGVCIEGSAKNLLGPEPAGGNCEGAGAGYTTVVDLGSGGLRVDVEFTNGPANSSKTIYWVCTNVAGGCHGSACGYITVGTITTDSNGQGFFSTVLPDGNPYPGRYVHFDLGGAPWYTSVTHEEIFPVPVSSAALSTAGMSMEVGIGDPTEQALQN